MDKEREIHELREQAEKIKALAEEMNRVFTTGRNGQNLIIAIMAGLKDSFNKGHRAGQKFNQELNSSK